MNKSKIAFTIFLISSYFFIFSCSTETQKKNVEQGLIGAYYGNADLTRVKSAEVLPDLDREWDEVAGSGHGSEWSGKYEGFIIAPVTGDVSFHLETNRHVILVIDRIEVDVQDKQRVGILKLQMQKGKNYPMTVIYMHDRKGVGFMRVKWSWEAQYKTTIPANSLFFTAEQAKNWNYIIEPESETIDISKFLTVPARNVIVFDEPGRFGGWPANNGIWSWDDEIVVGFVHGYYQASELHHSIDKTRPQTSVLARSLDGGETWSIEDPDNF
ncbi:MAG: hypothetical protein JSW07_17370, partial [bacterium]